MLLPSHVITQFRWYHWSILPWQTVIISLKSDIKWFSASQTWIQSLYVASTPPISILQIRIYLLSCSTWRNSIFQQNMAEEEQGKSNYNLYAMFLDEGNITIEFWRPRNEWGANKKIKNINSFIVPMLARQCRKSQYCNEFGFHSKSAQCY